MEEEKTENAGEFEVVSDRKNDDFNELLIKAKDDSTAQFQLGVKYYKGDGVEQNYEEAFKWFIKSAENGNSKAQYNLAVMYESGEGVDIDIEEARKWYKKAVDNGDKDAEEALKELENVDDKATYFVPFNLNKDKDEEEDIDDEEDEIDEEEDKIGEEDKEEEEEAKRKAKRKAKKEAKRKAKRKAKEEVRNAEEEARLVEEELKRLDEDLKRIEEEEEEYKKENKGIPIIAPVLTIILIIGLFIGFKSCQESERHSNYSSHTPAYNSSSSKKVNTSQTVTQSPTLDSNIKYTDIVLDKKVLYQLGYNPADKKNFTSVKIPYTFEFKGNHYKITKIGEKAFFNYGALQIVTIEEGVQILGVSAFENCISLKTVKLPSSINKINNNVFANCKALANVNLPEGLTELRDSIFFNCMSLKTIEIPNSVTKIGDMVFYKCKSLEKITIPENVTSIGQSAFAGCRGITELEIPNNVTTIKQWAFSNCVSLNKVSIPDGVSFVGDEAFCNVPYVYYDGSASGQPWGALDSNKMPVVVVNDPFMLGGISMGNNWQQVLSMYGTPDDIQVYVPEGYPNSRCRYACYYNYSLIFNLNDNDYILDITTLSKNGVKTPHGIQVGDSESKLISTYGSDLQKYDNTYVFSVNGGYRGAPPVLFFSIENGKISKIKLDSPTI